MYMNNFMQNKQSIHLLRYSKIPSQTRREVNKVYYKGYISQITYCKLFSDLMMPTAYTEIYNNGSSYEIQSSSTIIEHLLCGNYWAEDQGYDSKPKEMFWLLWSLVMYAYQVYTDTYNLERKVLLWEQCKVP